MEMIKVTPERLASRKVEAERKEREMLRPYTVNDIYFVATKADAESLDGAIPFVGERYEQPTKENGLKQVAGGTFKAVYMKSDDPKSPFSYRQFIVDVDDLEFWSELGAKTSVAVMEKKAAPKKAPKKD